MFSTRSVLKSCTSASAYDCVLKKLNPGESTANVNLLMDCNKSLGSLMGRSSFVAGPLKISRLFNVIIKLPRACVIKNKRVMVSMLRGSSTRKMSSLSSEERKLEVTLNERASMSDVSSVTENRLMDPNGRSTISSKNGYTRPGLVLNKFLNPEPTPGPNEGPPITDGTPDTDQPNGDEQPDELWRKGCRRI